MAEPKVSWTVYEDEKFNDFPEWNIGKINAGTETPPTKEIYLWNNKGGDADLADMQDTSVTIASDDANSQDVITGHWIHARCESIAIDEEGTDIEPDLVGKEIGGDQLVTLNGEKQREGVIKGTKNDGLLTNSSCFSKFILTCQPPDNAVAGPRSVYARIVYYYT